MPIVATDPPETVETILRLCLEAFTQIPNAMFRGLDEPGPRTTYEMAAILDRYFEPRVVLCRLLDRDGNPPRASIGVGLDEPAALRDAIDAMFERYKAGTDIVRARIEGALITAGYDTRILRRSRAAQPAGEIPKAKQLHEPDREFSVAKRPLDASKG